MTETAQEIQKADPRARRHALVVIACGILLGSILIPLATAYRPAAEDWLSQDRASRLRLASVALAVAFGAPALGFAAYLSRVGGRIVRSSRFPAPDTTVVRDTVVLRGRSARRRGRFMQCVAALVVVAAAGFSIVVWRLISLLESRAG